MKLFEMMKVESLATKPWNIPQGMAKVFSKEELDNILATFSRTSGSDFLIVDYHKQKIISGSSSIPVLCGFSKEYMEKAWLDIYPHVLSTEELEWFTLMNMDAQKVFYSYPESKRKSLVFIYDLEIRAANQKSFILHHRLVPYQLCKNGNLWLGLCFVTVSFRKISNGASIVNFETGEKYNFVDHVFQLSEAEALTQDDLKILEWMSNDMSTIQISSMLQISESSLMRKKRKLYDKLGVNTSAGAIHKAHIMGLI